MAVSRMPTAGGEAAVDPVPTSPPWTPLRWRVLAGGPRLRALPTGLDRVAYATTGRIVLSLWQTRRAMAAGREIHQQASDLSELSDQAFERRLGKAREAVARGRRDRAAVVEGLAALCETSRRSLGLEPYPNQAAAAWAMSRGRLVELATGEGKTLVAGLVGGCLAWRGQGCHVVTTNDYLADRDAATLEPLYRRAGLTVGAIEEEMDDGARRAAYGRDVTYLTNKSVAADFLRDTLRRGPGRSLASHLARRLGGDMSSAFASEPVQRGLAACVVDEADSILIDDAVTPLILSSSDEAGGDDAIRHRQAAEVTESLRPGRHYTVDAAFRQVRLTAAGRAEVLRAVAGLQAPAALWASPRMSEELATQTLTAREFFHRDRDYVVHEGKVVIVDAATGRLMPDRTWQHGLQQAIEVREGVELTGDKRTLAKQSFQRFFRRYAHLSGMTGTAWEARHELHHVYGLVTLRIPTHRPVRRRRLPTRLHAEEFHRLGAVTDETQRVHATGRPVLVGTTSVEVSERLSDRLTERGLPHRVLNAVRHDEEAAIVAEAGRPEKITIATNMAGRGTDIKLDPRVKPLGGLHVIACGFNDAARTDRQLHGRAGRQGDPGSARIHAAVTDELLRRNLPAPLRRLAPALRSASPPLARRLFPLAQWLGERRRAAQRRMVTRADDELDDALGFAGREF